MMVGPRCVQTRQSAPANNTCDKTFFCLGVYSVGRTLKEAKRNFRDALDLHLSVLREKTRRKLATVVAR